MAWLTCNTLQKHQLASGMLTVTWLQPMCSQAPLVLLLRAGAPVPVQQHPGKPQS